MGSLSHSQKNRTQVQSLVLLSLLFLFDHRLQISNMFVNAASNVHIVYLGERQHDDPEVITNSHRDMLAALLGSKEAAHDSILYSYSHGFSGFAAKLTKSQADLISDFHGVLRVIPNRIHKLHTTRSWEFLGLNSQSRNLLSEGNMGDGAIIGVIDTGIWPESESFSDKNMGPIPSRWKGICQYGQLFNSTNCNRKLIGARWFIKGIIAEYGDKLNTTESKEFLSPRDALGHGTHTSSTATGNFVGNASFGGLGKGIAKGGAPLSRLAMYKACWSFVGCADADLLKAFDEAIHDNVDVLSVSIGGRVPLLPYIDEHDGIAIGSFHAVAKGITVVCSAGNDGPFAQTVVNTAPWIISVAASTIDRAFLTAITLGNNQTLLGQSMDVRKHKKGFRQLVYSEHIGVDTGSGSASCKLGSLNATLVAGKVVLCFSITDREDIQTAALSVFAAEGVGVIFAQYPSNNLAPCELIPCIQVNYQVGTEIISYIQKARSPVVKLGNPKTVVGEWVSPKVAYFSSRGPSSLSPAVLKPDIAAPGVNILAAWPIDSTNHGGFAFDSGTSMACPHVAGIAALIKSLHPHWSPAAIKSAFVTTASTIGTNGDPIVAEGGPRKKADPFDYGGGQINPNKAADPGLIYDMGVKDYVQFLCSMGYNNSAITRLALKPISCTKNRHSLLNLNLPSISVPNLIKTITISRTVTNVGPINSQYKALVQSPPGIKIVVKPPFLSFNATTTKITFRIIISSTKEHGDYSFGSLTWYDREHLVRSHIAVRAINFYSDADI